VKCIIDCQVVLSRAPEGPLASHIGPFARSLSKQGYSLYSIHQQVRLAACFSRYVLRHSLAARYQLITAIARECHKFAPEGEVCS
jgi:integrase/recombinase XerD